MYSEIPQKLSTHELEILVDSLEFTASTHIRWISGINQSLICREESEEMLCADSPPHINCQFTLWRNGVSNKDILDDELFQKLVNLHEQLHFEACSLQAYLNEKQFIPGSKYSEFTNVQFDFFKQLNSMVNECREAFGVVDSLTKLPNRHAFEEILLQEENRIKRNKIQSVIAVVGIDNFKVFNDTHGRLSGDLVLIQMAAQFKNSLRNFDTVARYSGTKFILYLPETTISSAETILERLRVAIENIKFEVKADISTNLTCTFSLGQLSAETSSAEDLSRILSRLESAQSSGENNSVISS